MIVGGGEVIKEYWIFTFGKNQPHAGQAVKIAGSYGEARKKMCEKYGIKWAFQYSEKEWKEFQEQLFWKTEEIMEVIE